MDELPQALKPFDIAYSNPLVEKNPGVVYPANLIPDLETGIGSWSLDQIITIPG